MAKLRLSLLIGVLLSLATLANAQDPTDADTCSGPIYTGKEVSRRMKIRSYPPPETPNDKSASEIRGTVILDVVACSTGRITNITVVQPQPYGLTEAAIKAARKVTFRPAEKDGVTVSQRVRFEYHFNM
jgi:TonB family protein